MGHECNACGPGISSGGLRVQSIEHEKLHVMSFLHTHMAAETGCTIGKSRNRQ